ncbi:uncharacterized protein N7511_005856 [Penicillium nucicola]|uniref:uncharacterized protein n=1 Tax=Penicillium nucicola TaxID=1850975 RepID=UPI002544F315|nr:uncharacterized protein N7511_005856 [Penicillium nucicola]KAJ5762474.1 hypothetical protein N7511_005856 [Penicillium nucicola]
MKLKIMALTLMVLPVSLADLQLQQSIKEDLRGALTDLHSALSSYEGGYLGLVRIRASMVNSRTTMNMLEDWISNAPILDAEESAAVVNTSVELRGMFTEVMNIARVKVPLVKAAGQQDRMRTTLQPFYEQDMRYGHALQAKMDPEQATALKPIFDEGLGAYDAVFRAL